MFVNRSWVFTSNQSQRFRDELKIGFQFTWRTSSEYSFYTMRAHFFCRFLYFTGRRILLLGSWITFQLLKLTRAHAYSPTLTLNIFHCYSFREKKEEDDNEKTKTIRNAEPRWKTDFSCRIFYKEYFILSPLLCRLPCDSITLAFFREKTRLGLTRWYLHQLKLNKRNIPTILDMLPSIFSNKCMVRVVWALLIHYHYVSCFGGKNLLLNFTKVKWISKWVFVCWSR